MVRLVLFWSCICHVSFHLVVSHHRSSVSLLAFTLLCDETLRPPVGQRSPQPLKGTKGKESQPNQAGNNVDGPHTSHDISILVVLEFAVKLPWSPLEEELAAQAGHKVVTQRCASHCSQPTLHRHQNAVPNQQEHN